VALALPQQAGRVYPEEGWLPVDEPGPLGPEVSREKRKPMANVGGCTIRSVELLVYPGQNAGLGPPGGFLPIIQGGQRSQADPNVLGPTNNPNGDTTPGEYRYSLMVLWRGQNLDRCVFKRWVSRMGVPRQLLRGRLPPALHGRG
jgi:hypothetical protein